MTIDTPGETRFLRYERTEPFRGGLLHHTRNLCHLLREAHVTARLAIPPPLDPALKHNNGMLLQGRWEHYYDFGTRCPSRTARPGKACGR